MEPTARRERSRVSPVREAALPVEGEARPDGHGEGGGVEAVGATSWLPANGRYHVWGYGPLDPTGQQEWIPAQVRVIDGDLLKAMRIPLLRGRVFTASDGIDSGGVAMISRSLAQRVYGNREPLGQRFRMSGEDFTVVGVVGDVAQDAHGTAFDMVYLTHDEYA